MHMQHLIGILTRLLDFDKCRRRQGSYKSTILFQVTKHDIILPTKYLNVKWPIVDELFWYVAVNTGRQFTALDCFYSPSCFASIIIVSLSLPVIRRMAMSLSHPVVTKVL